MAEDVEKMFEHYICLLRMTYDSDELNLEKEKSRSLLCFEPTQK